MTHINHSTQTQFRVRLAKTTSELKTLLQLRYEVMRTEFPMYVPENSSKIDIDQWDAQSHHLGLWQSYRGHELPVGYMRIIQTNPSPLQEQLCKIVKANLSLEAQTRKTSTRPIKFLDKYQNCTGVGIKYNGFPSDKIMEGSRLSVKKEYRNMNPGRLLVEASFALFFNEDQFPHGFIEVRENHLAAYARYGFSEVASKYVPQDHCSHYLCYAHCTDLPNHLTEKLGSMRQEYNRKGEITFNPPVQGGQMLLSPMQRTFQNAPNLFQ